MKQAVLALILAGLLCLTACGTPKEQTVVPGPAPEQTDTQPQAPVDEMPAASQEDGSEAEQPEEPEQSAEQETPQQEPQETVEPLGPTVDDFLAFVDQPLADLIAALGEPETSRYEESCSGPGDDGVLEYAGGFIVFTYREPDGSNEVVVDAEGE